MRLPPEHDGVLYERFPTRPTPPPVPPAVAAYGDPDLDLLATAVDRAFYGRAYPDLSAQDPVRHYALIGWREGRRPNTWFDPEYYRGEHEDVRGGNPLLHWLRAGRAEGRAPRRPGGPRRDAVEGARTLAEWNDWDAAPGAAKLMQGQLLRHLTVACLGTRGLVISVSHDRYINQTGGTQLLIQDEQLKFNGDRVAYVHISPRFSRLTLGRPDPLAPEDEAWLQVVVDGVFVGLATWAMLGRALDAVLTTQALRRPDHWPRLLVVHCLLGHRPEDLTAFAALYQPTEAFLWLHDYSTLCESPHLLRNDAVFCAAPPPTSMACRVCSYGPRRAAHLGRVQALFAAVPFHVVAPSEPALAVWRGATALPHRDSRVHPHSRLTAPRTPRPAATGLPRIAAIGHQSLHKGWPFVRELVHASAGRYEFLHFASANPVERMDAVEPVIVDAGRAGRNAMARALADHEVDLVIVASPWAETFSFVTYEALAAGADVIGLADGGNVPALIRGHARGAVLADEHALLAWFAEGRAADYVAALRGEGLVRGTLLHDGGTATLEAAGAPPRSTTDPDLHLFVDGKRVDPIIDGDNYRFKLEPELTEVEIVSRTCVPEWQHADGRDIRLLGVAVGALWLNGDAIPLDARLLTTGWHAPEAGLRWTQGRAALRVLGIAELRIKIVSSLRYWRTAAGTAGMVERAE